VDPSDGQAAYGDEACKRLKNTSKPGDTKNTPSMVG
jgi:hypothetical protein